MRRSKSMITQDHAGPLARPHSLTWKVDDGRGRDVFRGNMSTHCAPNGRCHFDPKLAPMATPGPTSCGDEIAPARKVPGMAFGRCTEIRCGLGVKSAASSSRPRRKKAPPKEPRPKGEPETYELFGTTFNLDAEPVAQPSPRKDPLKAIAFERTEGMGEPEPHGTRFLTAERKTMLSLKPNSVVSPGPVYDLRTCLLAKPVRPAAFTKERKFEQARFEGTYRPPSFTPGPLTHEPQDLRPKPCSVLMVPDEKHVPTFADEGAPSGYY